MGMSDDDTMTEENEKKPCRNPSGIPPLPSDSEEENDGEREESLNDAPLSNNGAAVVLEGEDSKIESDTASRDPPSAQNEPIDTVNDQDNDSLESNDKGGASEESETAPTAPQQQQDASIPTTDEQIDRVEPINATRVVSQNDNKDETTTTSSASPVSQDEGIRNHPQQQRPMPPNIIKAALQEEVQQHDEEPEMVPEQPPLQDTRQDEKKSEEQSDDVDLMPPPEQTTNGNVLYSSMQSPQRDEQLSVPSSSVLSHSHSLPPFPDQAFQLQQQMAMLGYAPMAPVAASPFVAAHAPPAAAAAAASGGRRKITLRLLEDAPPSPSHVRRPSFFFRHSAMLPEEPHGMDRGSISVSWFEGTTSTELQEHVRKSLIRKMGIKGTVKLHDLRIIDETMDPPEEIVLSPFIPDGSHFLLRFRTKQKPELDSKGNFASRYLKNQIASTAPVSPSAAPSPHHSASNLLNLSEEQLATLQKKLKGLEVTGEDPPKRTTTMERDTVPTSFMLDNNDDDVPLKKVSKSGEDGSKGSTAELMNEEDVMMMDPDDQIEARMRQLTDLLINERRGKREKGDSVRRQEKKQVIFVMANYFVLFLSLIAIMAEIQSRAPRWLEWAESNLESVQSCATDQESLFKCVSNGDFSGLIAAIILWFGRSAATRRFFLFGFETPKRLWTVVYEALVTAFCWGISYMFIRRGMNPDTRQNFISKYWKDAVYGSLAGFNASFLKAVLKNLIPQEALEDALQERHIKILSFLPSFH